MYGMVINALEQMVTDRLGGSAWSRVCDKANVEDTLFLAMSPYPDEVTFALAGAAAEEFELPMGEFLEEFGRCWVPFALTTAYGPLLRGPETLLASLEGLDKMHSQIKASLPVLRPPSFKVESDDAGVNVHYFSDRVGLAPFVVGLLYGLAEMHAQEVTVRHVVDDAAVGDHEVFRVDYL
ncbi:MAG: heme NO-binding domain-containing protein [Thermoanaerobaculia bacterium]|nr:heme NO-binding domain-containing protein [Thermoanaerobaculia bacterium]